MKASELRIGNIILGEKGKIIKVESINSDYDINVIEAYGEVSESEIIDRCFGILLTEDWLFKFGFKETGKGMYRLNISIPFEGDHYIEAGDMNEKGIYFNYWVNGVVASVNKHFVHELQNLIKEITGNELQNAS